VLETRPVARRLISRDERRDYSGGIIRRLQLKLGQSSERRGK
jgi:hypothetical protein